jgi:hypothetical protein
LKCPRDNPALPPENPFQKAYNGLTLPPVKPMLVRLYMNQKWLIHKDRKERKASFAGPKALAVLSCALALLTAQPWTARAEQRSQTAAVRSIGGSTKVDGQSANSESTSTTTPQKNVVAAIRREVSGGDSHARIQATWAAIHNWIVAKLFASDSAVKHLDVQTTEQIRFQRLPDLDERDLPVNQERQLHELQWTLERLLLAPPAC